jgi:hypothetical protein
MSFLQLFYDIVSFDNLEFYNLVCDIETYVAPTTYLDLGRTPQLGRKSF